MKKYNCQNVCYIILCALVALMDAQPISDDKSAENPGPTTTTTTTSDSALLDTQLSEMQQQQSLMQDFNNILILEPILEEPIPFENNQRVRRSLTQAQLNEPADVDFDMEVAEVNVFRPLFRYRAEVARRGQQTG